MTILIAPLFAGLALAAAACGPVGRSEAQSMPAGQATSGGEWFRQTGCTDCHSISAYRMWNIAAQGPDLSVAVEDVPKRFGRSLEDFLHAPSGTMAMVLSTRIPLTDAERDVAIAKLHEAYRRPDFDRRGSKNSLPPRSTRARSPTAAGAIG